jgi:hypothetical protein
VSTAVRNPPHHNTLTCYVGYRCRRPECVDRMRAYGRKRRRQQAAGITLFVDARPVREHIYALQAAGITPCRIGALAGLPERTVAGFIERQRDPRGKLLGLRQKTTPRVAELILAINPDPLIAAKVNSIPSRRRVQALIAAGWPQAHIVQRGGVPYSTLADVMRKPTIMHSTAAAVARAYDELHDLRPLRNGVSARQAKMSRDRAASYGWLTPKYWDHPDHPIDDPEFEPQSAGQAVAEEARWLMKVGGLGLEQAAKRLRRSYTYVYTCLQEHPPADEQVAA